MSDTSGGSFVQPHLNKSNVPLVKDLFTEGFRTRPNDAGHLRVAVKTQLARRSTQKSKATLNHTQFNKSSWKYKPLAPNFRQRQ